MAVESLLTFAAKGILEKVASLAAQEISLAWGFKAELKKLSESLSVLQDFLGDAAEQAQARGKAVEVWVKKLKDIAHDADDVLDEINYENLRSQVELRNNMKKKVKSFLSSSNPTLFRRKMACKIKKINTSLADLKSEASFLGLVAKTIDAPAPEIRWYRETNSLVAADEVIVGREKVVSSIIATLTNSDVNQENLSVMAIVGMPGLGKTTLAKLVYNDNSINRFFAEKMWVCVSNTFDANSILSRILELLDPTKVGIQSQEALLENLQRELKDKRYLLVFDDVWNEDPKKWKMLISCLSMLDSARGSKIIVTTRSAKVASITETLPRRNMGILSVDDCWSILKDKAFSDNNAPLAQDLEKIGRQIAEHCAGLPLVAKVLGGLLRSKHSIAEWLSIKESRIWDLPEGEDKIISVLRLSFDNLKSPSLKQCFAYSSMFMKDIEIEKDNLIQLWMAQGLLHPSSDKSNLEMEAIGDEYFDILLQSSLFKDATHDAYGIVTKCKMHDLVHDLTELVSKSEILTQDFHERNDTTEIRHVARVSSSILERIPGRNLERLRSVFPYGKVPSNILPRFKTLRLLNLAKAKIKEIPGSIGKLKHLRYLDVSGTSLKALPKSIHKLYNLQTLRAMRCYSLKEFPDEVNNLISLRHVYFDKSMKFPFGMGHLTDLRTLPHFSVGKGRGHGIEELASLNQLKGELTLYNLEHVRDRDKARKAKLEDKKNLRHLRFVWTEDMSTTNNNNEDVLEGLQPHCEFESLVIEHFRGAKFPSWMMSRLLPLNNLKKIHLRRCNKCEGVPTLGHLPNLQHLRIDRMAELKCIGADFYGYNLVYNATRSRKETTTLFPALKQLSISECRELIEWMEAPKLSTEVFPCLEELHILNCPKLRNAPIHFPLLKDLWISSCDNVQPLKNITSRLTSLTSLTIDLNKKITSLPKGMLESNKNLTSVEILSCEKLTCIAPNVLGCCTSLQKLHVYDCKKLRRLPDGIDTLPLLEKMTIRECPRLEFIPMTHGMASLRKLHIDSCGGLSGLPSGLQYCTSLQALSIMGCGNLTVIPVTHDLSSLRTLKIGDCEGLSCLPSGLEHFSSLQELSVWNCPIVTSIPISNGVPFTSLQVLEIENCMELSSFPALENCPSLRKLMIRNCPKLAFISALSLTNPLPSSRSENFTSTSLDSLEYLSIRSCSNLHSIPDLDSFTSLGQLWIHNCERLEIRATSLCVSLEELKLTSLPKPESIPSLDNLTSLCMVAIYDCGNLKIFPRGLHCLTRLKTLTIGGFSEELDCFPDFPILSRLKRLTLRGWPKLKSLPQQIQHFTSLTHLCIMSFDGVEALPDWLGNLTYLWQLEIVNCKNLMYLPTVKAMQRLTNLLNLEIRCCPFLGERCTAETGSEWHKVSHILTFKVVDSESCRVLKPCDASSWYGSRVPRKKLAQLDNNSHGLHCTFEEEDRCA